LADVDSGKKCKMRAVKDNSKSFLQYVIQVGLAINSSIKVVSKNSFDDLITIEVNKVKSTVSKKFADNIYVEF
jgi:DtxR family Mn-dependent transcriptional regulator